MAEYQRGGTDGSGTVVAVASLREFFRTSVDDALRSQNVRADALTAYYLVDLLTQFARAEHLYHDAPEGRDTRPLALMLAEALESGCERERDRLLQRLGDVALFVAGFFARGFARRLVDVDYYITMGGAAYGRLSESRHGPRSRAHRDIFAELAGKFQPFVDVLNEIADSARVYTNRDVPWLYESWLRTDSPRAASKLRELGVIPVRAGRRSG